MALKLNAENRIVLHPSAVNMENNIGYDMFDAETDELVEGAGLDPLRKDINLLKEQVRFLEQITFDSEIIKNFSEPDSCYEEELTRLNEQFREELESNRQMVSSLKKKSYDCLFNMFLLLKYIVNMLQHAEDQSEENVGKQEASGSLPGDDVELNTLIRQVKNSLLKWGSTQDNPITLPDLDQGRVPLNSEIAVTTDRKVIESFWETESRQKASRPVNEKTGAYHIDSKYAYVINRVAGEDLFDKSGKLIIAKNEYITEKVIHKAETEGKFVEMIINMKLQPQYEG